MRQRERHGMTGTRVYHIWRQMRYRCRNANAPEYDRYGGRGIRVCPKWDASFEAFYKDMGDPPTDKHTIERSDNNKGYRLSNCYWATYKQQLNNTRANRLVTAFGKTQSLTLWAEEYNLPVTTLKNRLFRAKMDPEEALKAGLYAQQRRKRS
jgi:hypothetical protein